MPKSNAQRIERIGPQPGFQTKFLSSKADIVIGGGAAGCGKTMAALLAAMRYCVSRQLPDGRIRPAVRDWRATFFRRTTVHIKNQGGLWDASQKVYPQIGGKPRVTDLEWRWAAGPRIKMAHLEHETTIEGHQGSEVPLFIFDELTHFTAKMFWYFLSRNRSTSGIRAKIMATCNPDADSWVAELIAWWIDQDEALPDGSPNPRYGFPIPERAGKLRYFTRMDDQIVWGDTQAEVIAAAPGIEVSIADVMMMEGCTREKAIDIVIRSLTFIPGKLEENKKGDPRYRGNLMALDRVMRKRLLDGNWKVRPSAGDYFKRNEVRLIEEPPAENFRQIVRRWDLAATEPTSENPDPDWTCGVKMGQLRTSKGGQYVILHVEFARERADKVRQLIRTTAENDGTLVHIGMPQDPAQAGKDQVFTYVQLLEGFYFEADLETGDKITRAEPFAAQWQGGNVLVVRAHWNAQFFSLMEGFPAKNVHDDPVDASAGAFRQLLMGRTMYD